jgi:hypothetical protein
MNTKIYKLTKKNNNKVYPKYINKKKTRKNNRLQKAGSAAAANLHTSSSKEDIIKNKLESQMKLFIDIPNPVYDITRILVQQTLYINYLSGIFKVSGTISKEKPPIKKDFETLYQSLQEKITNYDRIDDENYRNSKIISLDTHCCLPSIDSQIFKSVMVPDNIIICFKNPITHFGGRNFGLFDNIKPDNLPLMKKIYEYLFTYKQNLDDEILKSVSLPYSWYANTSYFKHCSWYYPGEVVPNVVFSYENKDNENTENKYSKFQINEISYFKEGDNPQNVFLQIIESDNLAQMTKHNSFTSDIATYIKKYACQPYRYLFLISGCRNIPYIHSLDSKPEKIERVKIFYQEILEREILYTIINRELSVDLPEVPKRELENLQIKSYFGNSYKYVAYNLEKQIQDVFFSFENLVNIQHHTSLEISRLNKVYEDIYKISKIREFTTDEVNYVRNTSDKKCLFFLFKLLNERNDLSLKPPTFDLAILNLNLDKLVDGFNIRQKIFYPIQSIINFIKTHNYSILVEKNIAKYFFFRLIRYSNMLRNIQSISGLGADDTQALDCLMVDEKQLKSLGSMMDIKQISFITKIEKLYCHNYFPKEKDIVRFISVSELILKNTILRLDIFKPLEYNADKIKRLYLDGCIFDKVECFFQFILQFPLIEIIETKKLGFSAYPTPQFLNFNDLSKLKYLHKLELDCMINFTGICLSSQSIITLNLDIYNSNSSQYNLLILTPKLCEFSLVSSVKPNKFILNTEQNLYNFSMIINDITAQQNIRDLELAPLLIKSVALHTNLCFSNYIYISNDIIILKDCIFNSISIKGTDFSSKLTFELLEKILKLKVEEIIFYNLSIPTLGLENNKEIRDSFSIQNVGKRKIKFIQCSLSNLENKLELIIPFDMLTYKATNQLIFINCID